MCSDVLRYSQMFSFDHRCFWIFSWYSIDVLLMFSRCSLDVLRMFAGFFQDVFRMLQKQRQRQLRYDQINLQDVFKRKRVWSAWLILVLEVEITPRVDISQLFMIYFLFWMIYDDEPFSLYWKEIGRCQKSKLVFLIFFRYWYWGRRIESKFCFNDCFEFSLKRIVKKGGGNFDWETLALEMRARSFPINFS